MIYIDHRTNSPYIAGVPYYKKYIDINYSANNPSFSEWIESLGGKVVVKDAAGTLCVAFEDKDSELAMIFKLKYV